MSARNEVQMHSEFSVEFFKLLNNPNDKQQANKALDAFTRLDAEWRKNIGLPERPQIERRKN